VDITDANTNGDQGCWVRDVFGTSSASCIPERYRVNGLRSTGANERRRA
jgi:hypothetical protein